MVRQCCPGNIRIHAVKKKAATSFPRPLLNVAEWSDLNASVTAPECSQPFLTPPLHLENAVCPEDTQVNFAFSQSWVKREIVWDLICHSEPTFDSLTTLFLDFNSCGWFHKHKKRERCTHKYFSTSSGYLMFHSNSLHNLYCAYHFLLFAKLASFVESEQLNYFLPVSCLPCLGQLVYFQNSQADSFRKRMLAGTFIRKSKSTGFLSAVSLCSLSKEK